MALHADPEVDAKVQGFLVGQPQLTGKLVDADFLGQLVVRSSPIEGRQSSGSRAWRGLPFSHNAGDLVHPLSHCTADDLAFEPARLWPVRGPVRGPARSRLPAMPPLFGHEEGAALVAVERANGGELAPLLQVLWTLYGFTPPASRPTPGGFAASARLLIEVGLVEYVDQQLGLTPHGRRLLRRSGMPNDPRHVTHVTDLLQEFDEIDVERDISVEAPARPTCARRSATRTRSSERVEWGLPFIGDIRPVTSSILGLAGGGLIRSEWMPAVLPDAGEEGSSGEDGDYGQDGSSGEDGDYGQDGSSGEDSGYDEDAGVEPRGGASSRAPGRHTVAGHTCSSDPRPVIRPQARRGLLAGPAGQRRCVQILFQTASKKIVTSRSLDWSSLQWNSVLPPAPCRRRLATSPGSDAPRQRPPAAGGGPAAGAAIPASARLAPARQVGGERRV